MNPTRLEVRLVATLWLVGAFYVAGPVAFAQQQTKAEPSNQLAEVVVTATKRETTVHDTPMSITAVTGADIEARGLTDLTALAQSVPGVSMMTSGPGQTELEMRGMNSGGGFASVVGFYLDDTPLTAPSESVNGKVVIDPNLYDLNRVEVLRGPQGTLYGSGSMGGTIRIISNAPNAEAFDASGQLLFSETDGGGFNHGENGMLNLPLINGTAALRIVGSREHESGWIDRVVIANGDFPLETDNNTVRGHVLAPPVAAVYKDVNDEDLTGARVELLWKPTDQLTIAPSYFYQRITQHGLSEIDSNPGTNAHYQPFNTPEPFSDRIDIASVNVKYAFNAFDVNSTTSRWSRKETFEQDPSEQFQWALGLPSFYTSRGGIGPPEPTPFYDDSDTQTSEEFRLSSSGNSRFQWLVGYFYSAFTDNESAAFIFPGAVPVYGTTNLFTEYNDYPNHGGVRLLQSSGFGELSYQLTRKLKTAAGLRRYHYNNSSHTNVGSGVFVSGGGGTIVLPGANQSEAGVTPKFDLSYEMDKNLLFYATAAQGFRPGADTAPQGPAATSGPVGSLCESNLQALYHTTAFVAFPNSVGPDSVWSYELGEKAEFLERRLTINGDVYFANWSGVQQSVTLPCGLGFNANAGDAHIHGTEVEIKALLGRGLTLSGNVGYTHATLVTELPGTGIPAGTAVQDIPRWTSTESLAYRHSISGQLTFTLLIENNHVGSRTDATYAVNYLPSYDLTSLRAGVEGDGWKAVLFAKNLFNQRALLSDTPQLAVNIPTFNRIAVSQPLTVGIDLSYDLGR